MFLPFGCKCCQFVLLVNVAGAVTGVVPATAPVAGDTLVTISGTNLGSGSDITAVTLANVQADIVSQTASQVVVRTRSASELSGNIVVRSLSMGIITLQNSFSYVPRTCSLYLCCARAY